MVWYSRLLKTFCLGSTGSYHIYIYIYIHLYIWVGRSEFALRQAQQLGNVSCCAWVPAQLCCLAESGLILASGVIWSHLESCGVIWSHLEDLESSGVIWNHLEWFGVIWSHLESSGIIWSHLDIREVFGEHLGKHLGVIWTRGAEEASGRQMEIRSHVSSLPSQRNVKVHSKYKFSVAFLRYRCVCTDIYKDICANGSMNVQQQDPRALYQERENPFQINLFGEYAYTCKHTHTYIHTYTALHYIHTYIHTDIHTYIYAYMHSYIYTCIHT